MKDLHAQPERPVDYLQISVDRIDRKKIFEESGADSV